jgi:hypothetical protein
MKKLFFLLLVFFIFINCNGDSDETVKILSSEISVSSSKAFISWTDKSDLIDQLENSLSFNYEIELENKIIKETVINSDSTLAIATIKFKNAFQANYKDPIATNNSESIVLQKKEIIIKKGVELKADGTGNTYELISSVLAPGYNPIETPDCNHAAFGNHIDEIFDNELNRNVFRFYIHTTPDNDRCLKFDRQRNEIKTYDKSPDNLKGTENEKVIYEWKFKLNSGFQSSPNFTHLHQLKSVGGSFESMPMYTLTARKGSPDKLELRYAETDKQITLTQTEITPLIGRWLKVTETISYGTTGTYKIEIKKVSDESVLFTYSNNSIINWRPNATFVRPKWGIYRSLINEQDLRDEILFFADFIITEID